MCVHVSFNCVVTLSVLTYSLPLRHNISHKQGIFTGVHVMLLQRLCVYIRISVLGGMKEMVS